MARSNLVLPILHGMVNVMGSLHLHGIFFWITTDTFLLKVTFSFPLRRLLLVQSSLRNFAYRGTCLIASRRGMFTSTLQNVLRSSFSLSSFFDAFNLQGKGGKVIWEETKGFEGFIWGVAPYEVLGLSSLCVVSSSRLVDTCCFLLLIDTALTFSLGFTTVCEGSLLECCASSRLAVVASCPI